MSARRCAAIRAYARSANILHGACRIVNNDGLEPQKGYDGRQKQGEGARFRRPPCFCSLDPWRCYCAWMYGS